MTDRAIQLVAVGDAALRQELEAALSGAGRGRCFLRSSESFDGAERLLRQRPADLVVIELGTRADALRRFVATSRALTADALLVGVESNTSDGATPAAVLAEAVRSRLDDLLARPLSSDALKATLVHLEARLGAGAARKGSVLTFHSTKGGVGKSTLSINTAVGLALRHPDEVLLIDCSLQLGVCASALDLAPQHSLATAARERDRLDARLLRELSTRHAASGLRLLSAPSDAVDASDVDDAAMAQILSIARRDFRFVIVDTLPIIDAVILGVFDLADRIYVVNQGTVPDVIGAARLLALLDRLEIPAARTRVVLNRNMAPFPGQLDRADIGKRLGRAVDFEVPYERRVLSALNLGEPHVLSAGRRGWGAVIGSIVDDASSLGSERAQDADPRDVGLRSEDDRIASDTAEPLGWRRRLLGFASGGRS